MIAAPAASIRQPMHNPAAASKDAVRPALTPEHRNRAKYRRMWRLRTCQRRYDSERLKLGEFAARRGRRAAAAWLTRPDAPDYRFLNQ
jgi:hypothetical protein